MMYALPYPTPQNFSIVIKLYRQQGSESLTFYGQKKKTKEKSSIKLSCSNDRYTSTDAVSGVRQLRTC